MLYIFVWALSYFLVVLRNMEASVAVCPRGEAGVYGGPARPIPVSAIGEASS